MIICGVSMLNLCFYFRKGLTETEVEKIANMDPNRDETKNSLRKMIFEFAIDDKEEICKNTLNLFIEILAVEISNTAVRMLPYSGIYLAGFF